jgi:hypothetical protein
MPNFRSLILQESGSLTISRPEVDQPAPTLRHIELNGGSISVLSNGSPTHSILISQSWLAKGSLRIQPTQRPSDGEEATYEHSSIMFFQVTFSSVEITIEGYNAEVSFMDCVFRPGAKLNIYTTTLPTGGSGSVSFEDCRFETDLFKARHFGPAAKIRTGTLVANDDCTYDDGIQKIRLEGGQVSEISMTEVLPSQIDVVVGSPNAFSEVSLVVT